MIKAVPLPEFFLLLVKKILEVGAAYLQVKGNNIVTEV
jgi:hypothetical protein